MVKMNQMINGDIKPSNKWLYIVLFITLVSTAWTALHGDVANDDASVELEVKKTSAEPQPPSGRSSNVGLLAEQSATKKSDDSINNTLIPWQKLKREADVNKPYDVFKVHSWVVVPPVRKPPPPPPPPPPKAPPAPFTYVGKLENSPKGTQVFLMQNNKLFSVVIGEKINPQWRLDSEDANTLRLTFIPLDLKQVLSKSAKQVVANAIEINQ